MNSEDTFWSILWVTIGLVFCIGLFPVASCTKQINLVHHKSINNAVAKGCSVIETTASHLIVTCPGTKNEKD